MKKALKIAGIVVAVLVVALLVAWLLIDSVAKTGIERGGSYATGTPTKVHGVSLSLLHGQVRLDYLSVANPEGFKTSHFLEVGKLDVGVVLGSFLGKTVEVTQFDIDGLDLNIEQQGGTTNVAAILDHIEKLGGQKDQPKEPSGKKLKVSRIVIRNVVAHIQVLPVGGEATTLDIPVPEIVLENVTQDNAQGIAVSELMRRLVPAILAAVVDKAKGIIPDADLNKLSGDITSATQALGQGAANLVNQAGGRAAKTLEGLGAGTKQTGEAVQKSVGGALDKIFARPEQSRGSGKKSDEPAKP